MRVTRETVQPSKLRTASSGYKDKQGRETEGGRVPRGESGHSRDSETLMCVCLLVHAPLSLSALLIPGFGDVKSFFHLFPCQLCSHCLQPSAYFQAQINAAWMWDINTKLDLTQHDFSKD